MTYTPRQIQLALSMLGVETGSTSAQRDAEIALDRLANHYASAPTEPDVSGGAHDPVTDLVYDPADPDECRHARTLRALCKLFEAREPSVPLWTYIEREERKERGRAIVVDAARPLAERIGGAQAVIRAHYARSAIDSLAQTDPFSFVWHPAYDEYAAHYLHASPTDSRETFGADVFEALAAIYPHPSVEIQLPRGQSYWPAPLSNGDRLPTTDEM